MTLIFDNELFSLKPLINKGLPPKTIPVESLSAFVNFCRNLDRVPSPYGIIGLLKNDGGLSADMNDPTHDPNITRVPSGRRGRKLESDALPSYIGSYQILGLLGEGGMGRVYHARQQDPPREVALKLLPNAATDHAALRDEYRALASMQHAAIATFYDVDSANGQLFFTMAYAAGQPLDTFIADHELDLPQRLDIFKQICSGIQHAHQKGFIHRDLKPANIMVNMDNQRPVVKILDFGIAAPLEAHKLPTGAGTPGYMSPEQYTKNPGDIRQDVYSLGVLLFEILIGQPMFPDPKQSSAQTVPKASQANPSPEQPIHKALLQDFDFIIAKATSHDPKQRYTSVNDLLNDIKAFENHEPINARTHTLPYQIRKLYQRKRLLFVAGLLVSLTFILASVATTAFAFREAKARRQAEDALNFLEKMLSGADPRFRNDGQNTKLTDLIKSNEALFEEIDFQPEFELRFSTILGNTWYWLKSHREAKKYYEKAYSLATEIHGENHPKNHRAYFFYLVNERRVPDSDVEQSDFQVLMNEQAKLIGKNHPETLDTLEEIAAIAYSRKNYREAKQNYTALLKGRQENPSDEPAILRAHMGLANVVYADKKYDEAIKIYNDVLPQQIKLQEYEHSEILSSRNNLAHAYLKTKKYPKAIEHFETNLEIRDRKTPDAEDTFETAYSLARGMLQNCDASAAVQLLAPRIERSWDNPNISSETRYQALSKLGEALTKNDRPQEAIDVLRPHIRDILQKKKMGPQALRMANNFANFLLKQGLFTEAIHILEVILPHRPTEKSKATTKATLAEALALNGQLEKALVLAEEAYKVHTLDPYKAILLLVKGRSGDNEARVALKELAAEKPDDHHIQDMYLLLQGTSIQDLPKRPCKP